MQWNLMVEKSYGCGMARLRSFPFLQANTVFQLGLIGAEPGPFILPLRKVTQ
jgi:hypothetical protein